MERKHLWRYVLIICGLLLICVMLAVKLQMSRVSNAFFTQRSLISLRHGTPCTPQDFRLIYNNSGYFPSQGSWVIRNNQIVFRPSQCRLTDQDQDPVRLQDCLTHNNITSIVTIGDSNGHRYFLALLDYLRRFIGECSDIKAERFDQETKGFIPDKHYYARDMLEKKVLAVHYRNCHRCRGRKVLCKGTLRYKNDLDHNETTENQSNGSMHRHIITLEQLPLTHILGTSIKYLVPFDMHRAIRTLTSKYYAETAPEFYLRYYLADLPPEILMVFLPFNHVKAIFPTERIRADIVFFHELVKTYMPPTTKVFYFPATAEFEETKPVKWRGITYNGLPAWKRIDEFNHLLFDVIKPDLVNKSSNIYGFFDLLSMSYRRPDLSLDGIHMKPRWYQHITSVFMEMLCRIEN